MRKQRGQMGQIGFHAHADLLMEARPLNRYHLPESSQYPMTSVQLLLSPESGWLEKSSNSPKTTLYVAEQSFQTRSP